MSHLDQFLRCSKIALKSDFLDFFSVLETSAHDLSNELKIFS